MEGAHRTRYVLFVVVSVAIAAPAIFFALRGPGDRPGDQGAGATAREPLPPALSAAEREQADQRRAELHAGGEDVHGHDEKAPPGLEEAGREFLRFYLLYEIGDTSGSVEAGLRRTATAEFAALLLEEAPRFPPGLGRAPVEARLLDIDAVPLADEMRIARIVGKLRRGGDLEAVAFELRLSSDGWLVSGVAG